MEQASASAGENHTRFDPPSGVSPALARVICARGYDGQAFAAALVNLAAGGHISCSEAPEGEFLLTRREVATEPTAAEAALLAKLFAAGPVVPVTGQSYLRLTAAMKAHYRAIKVDARKFSGAVHRLWLIWGMAGFALLATAIAEMRRPVLGSALAGGVWPVMLGIIFLAAGAAWFAGRGRDRRQEAEVGLAGYRDYLALAVAPRLEPEMSIGGELGPMTPEHAYIAALGLPNTALERFTAAVVSVAGHAPEHTSLHSLYRRSGKGRQRGWKFEEPSIFWRIW